MCFFFFLLSTLPQGKRVLVVDDVITAGTAIREAMDMLYEAEAVPAGVVIALDRQVLYLLFVNYYLFYHPKMRRACCSSAWIEHPLIPQSPLFYRSGPTRLRWYHGICYFLLSINLLRDPEIATIEPFVNHPTIEPFQLRIIPATAVQVRACLNPPPKSTGTNRVEHCLPDELVVIGCRHRTVSMQPEN